MNFIIQIILLIIGFAALMKGADWFVDGAAGIAAKLGIPQLIIGLTIVAMGTSAPEAAVSVSAALKGNTGICIGNVLGSNIMNILLILGITSTIVTLQVADSTVKYEKPFMITISVVLLVVGYIGNVVSFMDGMILWGLFLVYLAYLFVMTKKRQGEEKFEEITMKTWQMIAVLVIGLVLIIVGSDLTVDSATHIAKVLGVSERIIGLTIVAFGTSLPELVTSVTAARKGSADIAIGNIVGSNIFNILFVTGTTALIKPVEFSQEFIFDGIIVIASSVLLLAGAAKNHKLNRKFGIVMLGCYALYFAYILIR